MSHFQAALPEPEYLVRIGEVAYAVSYLEWMILGDLNRLKPHLPENLQLSELEAGMTAGIAQRIKAGVPDVRDDATRSYLTAVYRSLFGAAALRNDVLHARPATHRDGSQRLLRAEVINQKTTGHRFWIDDQWLDDAFAELNRLLDATNSARPPFPIASSPEL